MHHCQALRNDPMAHKRLTDRQTGRQTDRQISRQTDKETAGRTEGRLVVVVPREKQTDRQLVLGCSKSNQHAIANQGRICVHICPTAATLR